MIYKNTERIKEDISVLGIGCWNFGGEWDTSDQSMSKNVVLHAVESGINFFDIAPVYGFYRSEEFFGDILKKHKLRDKVIIASKCGLVWGDDHVTQNNLSKKSLKEEIDGSLKRLKTDFIDIWQLHWPDPSTPIEETCEVLAEIKKSGKIKYIGVSNFAQSDMLKIHESVGVDSQQNLFNMFEKNATSYHGIPLDYKTEDEVFPNLRKYGQAFFPYSPLFQGLLTGRFKKENYLSDSDIRNNNPKLKGDNLKFYLDGYYKLENFAKEIGRPVSEMVINWTRQQPEVTSIIGGVSSIEQLNNNIKALSWDLTTDELTKINEIITPYNK